jgi:hypothetical protein
VARRGYRIKNYSNLGEDNFLLEVCPIDAMKYIAGDRCFTVTMNGKILENFNLDG